MLKYFKISTVSLDGQIEFSLNRQAHWIGFRSSWFILLLMFGVAVSNLQSSRRTSSELVDNNPRE